MIPLIAVLITTLHATVAIPQQEPSKFERFFPRPTGANAVEDYVRAGDLLDQGGFQIYQAWQRPEDRPTAKEVQAEQEAREHELAQMTPEEKKRDALENPQRTTEELQLIDHVNSLSFYKLKEEESQRFAQALDLMSQGNRKVISFDFQHSYDISWLSSARKLARLSSDAAFVAFAAGQPSRASQVLNEALIMAHRIGGDSILAELSGIGNTSIALNRYNEHLGARSLSESKQIPTLVTGLLNDHDNIESMIQGERAEARRALEELIKDFKQTGSDDSAVAASEFRRMTPDQQSAWALRILQASEDHLALSARILDQPESTWLEAIRPEPMDAPVTSASDNGYDPTKETLREYADSIEHEGSLVDHREYILAMLRNRAQLRLLRLHARIIQHRWETGQLPKTIEELKLPPDETADPLSGKPFQYQLKNGDYRLFSAGIPETGEIELRYRRPPAGSIGGSQIQP